MIFMQRKDNVFSDVMVDTPETSKFDIGHEVKFTMNMGPLYPSCIMEAVPGDHFNLNYANLVRFAPLVAPVMHRVRFKTEYFFCPNRIIFPEWEEFITGTGTVGHPFIVIDGTVEEGSLADYMGIPPGDYDGQPITISAIPFVAYVKIWNEWYRDQNLMDEITLECNPGDNSDTNLTVLGDNVTFIDFVCDKGTGVLPRSWEHDYFTSCLPFSQQGTEVDLPLVNQGSIPVEIGSLLSPGILRDTVSGTIFTTGSVAAGAGPSPFAGSLQVAGDPAIYDPNGSLVVDVQAEAATINDLREAFALQAFLERTIRGGARYIEQIWSHFKVKSSDARLQRPEFICRSTQNLVISEVLSTAQSSNDGSIAEVAVGSLAGHGISVGGDGGSYGEVEEHGFIIGLVSAIPDTAYQDGIHKMFFKEDRLDYMWPSFAHLGEQAVLNKEIYALPASGYDPEGVFGYIPRYSEYRYIPSRVAGQFRSSLAYWTLGRRFDADNPPVLNAEFIACNPSRDIFAVTDPNQDTMQCQIIQNHTVVRKLPRYGIPSTLG